MNMTAPMRAALGFLTAVLAVLTFHQAMWGALYLAGMMPLALGWGADPSFRSPMAVAVIGGLVTSTLLSLLVVPAVFTYIDDIGNWLKRALRLRGTGAVAEPEGHDAKPASAKPARP